jgi:hypothetical protein
MRSLCRLVVLLLACECVTASAEENTGVIHGTINVVLANENGMVVLADSMLTNGLNKQLPQPGKKLFRLDDHSVCAIAGIIASPSGSYKELDLSTVAIVNDYARQISKGPPLTIQQKLRELASLLNISLSAVENVLDANGKSPDPENYTLELIVAGYDTDGLLKIGNIRLQSRNQRSLLYSSLEYGSIRTVTNKLDTEFGGMPDRAKFILGHPETVKGDRAVLAYRKSLKLDSGKSLTLYELADLAKRLKYYSTLVHPEVGGQDQIAILQAGRISSFSQPSFPDSASALRFSLMVDDSFSPGGMVIRGTAIFVRCSWNLTYVPLDGSFFISNEFKDSLLGYSGGPLHFDSTNRVVDSDLLVGPEANQNSAELRNLRLRISAGRTPNFDPMRLAPLLIQRR